MTIHIIKNSKYRDSRGERIWFPKDERPYYDKALNKVFHSAKEKSEYMKANNLHMDGSDDRGRNCPEAGDTRREKVK